MRSKYCSKVRLAAVEFLIESALQFQVTPIVKYSALLLFAVRFCSSLFDSIRSIRHDAVKHWLLNPIRESNLQLFALISIWISSKIHSSRPVSVKALKSWGDKMIAEQHFTTRDFFDAELVFLQIINFEIATAVHTFTFLEDLYLRFKEATKVGELLNFEACMDIMDLLYETDETLILNHSPSCLAASILVCSYVITVPQQTWEFPVLPWAKFVTLCSEEEIMKFVGIILRHIFETPAN